MKDCSPWEELRVHGGVSPVGGMPQVMQGKSVRSPLPKKEETAETMWDELTVTPTLHPPEGEKIGSEAEPKKKGGLEERWFYNLFSIFHSPTVI